MLSPQTSAGQRPSSKPSPYDATGFNLMKKVGEVSAERQRRNISSAAVAPTSSNSKPPTTAAPSGLKRTSSAVNNSNNKRPPSNGPSSRNQINNNNIKKPTPEIEMYATLIDAVTTAFQNRAPTLILPQNISSKIDFTSNNSNSNPKNLLINLVSLDSTMQNFACLAKEALEAFAALELSTSSAEKSKHTTPSTSGNLRNQNNDTTSYSTGVVAALGESAAVVAKRSEQLIDIMKQLHRLFSSVAPSSTPSSSKISSNLSLQYFSLLPPSFKKSVTTALDQGTEAINEVRLSAQSIHDVRKAIVSRDLESAQNLLLQATANLNEGLDGKPQPSSKSNNSSATFLPSLLLRWLRRHWIPAMKIWAEITKRFDEESARILKQNQLRLQSDEDTLAILNELLKKYRTEIIKKRGIELQAITMPGQGLEQLVNETIEQPLAKSLENLKRKSRILKLFQEGIENLNMVGLSQAVREWKKDIIGENTTKNNNENENNSLYIDAKKTIEKLQNLGRITAGLSMVSSGNNNNNNIDQNSNKKTSSSKQPSGVFRDVIYALNQAGTLVMNEKWFLNETQCSMSVAFCEKLLRLSNEKDIEKELISVASNNNNNNDSSSSSSSHHIDKERLLNLLVVQVESSPKKNPDSAKFWPIELSQLYTKVAMDHVVQKIQRRYLVEAITSLAGNINPASSSSSENQQQQTPVQLQNQEIMIAEARNLLDHIFQKQQQLGGNHQNNQNNTYDHNFSASAASLLISPKKNSSSAASSSPDQSKQHKRIHDAISRLQQAVADNSARTVKVHYESNLRLVRIDDSYSFAKTMNDIMTSLDIDAKLINERGPIRVRVADEDGDFITVVSQKEWDLVLKEFILAGSTANGNNNDPDSSSSGGKKKLELYLDHFRSTQQQFQAAMMKSPAAAVPGNSPTPNPQLNVTPTPLPPPSRQQQQQAKNSPLQPPSSASKNVFTTSNVKSGLGGAAIRQQQLFLGPANNRPSSSGAGLTPVKGKDAKKQISSLAIEGKSPSANNNNNNNNNNVAQKVEENHNNDNQLEDAYLSPPGARPPQPDHFPSRVLQHQVQQIQQEKQQQQQKNLLEKLQGARNQKILLEQKENKKDNNKKKKNQNDDDSDSSDDENEDNHNHGLDFGGGAGGAGGFWNKPPQEFDLMTVASATSQQTTKTDAESLLMMKALAQKKWGNNKNNKKNPINDEAFDLRTVNSEATNGFHLEDHLDLLMGKQEENAKKLKNGGGGGAVAINLPQRLQQGGAPANTHNRIFGGGANYSPFTNNQAYGNRKSFVKASPAAAVGRKKDDNGNDMMIQGKGTTMGTPR